MISYTHRRNLPQPVACQRDFFFFAEPITTIVGGPDMYINKGSTMNLTCIVKHSPEPPPAIFWTHNSQVSN